MGIGGSGARKETQAIRDWKLVLKITLYGQKVEEETVKGNILLILQDSDQ